MRGGGVLEGCCAGHDAEMLWGGAGPMPCCRHAWAGLHMRLEWLGRAAVAPAAASSQLRVALLCARCDVHPALAASLPFSWQRQ